MTQPPPAHLTDLPERPEAEQQAFHDAMHAAWRAAAARAPGPAVDIDLAGARVRLEFAGRALADAFLPALAHLVLPDDGGAPAYTLRCWATRDTGVEAPPPPCERFCYTERGDLWGMGSTRVRSAFHFHEFSVNVFDAAQRVGVYWVHDAAKLPYWSHASPLRTLLHWCAEADGAQLLHAAAVGTAEGAVLVTGRGGVGKSSTALACLADGMDYVGDDYVVVRVHPRPTVHALYATAKLAPGQLAHVPALAPLVDGALPADEKAVLRLVPGRAGQLARSRPLRAIVTPAFADAEETTTGPVAHGALQRAAAFTTLSQLPGAGRRTHAFIDRLVAELPGLTLHLGRDRARVPAALRALLAESDAALRTRARSEVPRVARPVLSVVIPVCNGLRFLRGCIDRVLAQDYAPLEIVVVDDGSFEDIAGEVRALPVDVRFVRQPNGGPAAARNRGMREASGELLAFLDVDDYWPPENLSSLVAHLLAEPELQVVRGSAQVVRADPAGGGDVYLGSPADAFPDYIGAAVFRREAFERVGAFDPGLRYGEDSDWFARARAAELPMRRVDEVTLFVRRHDTNMTRGRTLGEMDALQLLKRSLDRRRAAAGRRDGA